MNALESLTLRPYLIRAVHEWCSDQGLTPYVVVLVDESVQVPLEYVQNGQIVLNIDADATSALSMDNDYIAFKARFGGVPREVMVPVDRVLAIYARENGQGMAFPMFGSQGEEQDLLDEGDEDDAQDFASAPAVDIQLVPSAVDSAASDDDPAPSPPAPPRKRPALKRVK